ncbi:hypothetical protein D3C80_1906910 [compost metagenome]
MLYWRQYILSGQTPLETARPLTVFRAFSQRQVMLGTKHNAWILVHQMPVGYPAGYAI